MRTICLVQARLNSSRFKKKILADLHGKPVLQHVYERACQIEGVDEVVIATPLDDQAQIRRSLAARHCHPCILSVPGLADNDVLGRYRACATGYDVIVRVTADCPVLDPFVAGLVWNQFHTSSLPCDFASNDTLVSGYPDGWDVEVFSRSALETAAAQATDPADREHVTPWIKRNLRCVTLMAPEPWTGPKLSVDTPEDLETVRAWMAREAASG